MKMVRSKNKHFSLWVMLGRMLLLKWYISIFYSHSEFDTTKLSPVVFCSYILTADPNFSYGVVITPIAKHLYYSNYDVDGNQWINYYIINSDGSLTHVSHQRIDCDQRTRVLLFHIVENICMYIADWSGINFYDI